MIFGDGFNFFREWSGLTRPSIPLSLKYQSELTCNEAEQHGLLLLFDITIFQVQLPVSICSFSHLGTVVFTLITA